MFKIKFLESEFFKNNLGQESMSRLLPFMAFFPSSIILLYLHTETALISYMSTYTVGYIGGKGFDALNSKNPKRVK